MRVLCCAPSAGAQTAHHEASPLGQAGDAAPGQAALQSAARPLNRGSSTFFHTLRIYALSARLFLDAVAAV